jgi:hypothetical protein
MRRIQSIVVAGGVLATAALVGWMVVTLLTQVFREQANTTELTGLSVEPVDTGWEPDRCGVVKSVDAARGKIALGIATQDGMEHEQLYDLAKDAEILLDGPGTLEGLAVDMRVALKLEKSGKNVVAFRSEPFQISVEPTQDEVEVGKAFDVVLRVTNVSPTNQCLWVWSSSWQSHWRATNSQVELRRLGAFGNYPMVVNLASGDVYENKCDFKVMSSGRVSFRMGFTPLVSDALVVVDSWPRAKADLGKRTYWSREVTLTVSQGSGKQ